MHQLLGQILEIVQRNIIESHDYEIDSLLLRQINNLNLDAKNIFWHDVAMSYLRLNDQKYLKCIEKIESNNDSSYAKAQHILGHNYLKNGDLNRAFEYLSRVNEVDKEIYHNALIDLALVKEKQGDIDGAIINYKTIIKKTSKNDEEYAKAQQNLASLYVNKKQYTQAEKCLTRISEADTSSYADAQFSLGLISSLKGKDQEALNFYKNVKKKYSRAYSKAKFNEGNIHYRSEKLIQAKNSYEAVLDTEVDLYAKAQFLLGRIFLSENNFNELSKKWKNIPKDADFYPIYGYQIENTIEVESNVKITNINAFLNIIALVDMILKVLHIKSEYESSIAHYTNLTVSKILFSKIDNQRSPLRLNTINLMNDPKEGLLMHKLLNLEQKIITQDLAFISCFTLHHDSLNQFRLYAKEHQQEATGVSFIFSKDFFSRESNIVDILGKLDFQESKIPEYQELEEVKRDDHANYLPKVPLYRCIYLDPNSGLIKVAQREEWSFHREYKDENKQHLLESNPEAEKWWNQYQKEILEIESEVSKDLKEIVIQVVTLNQDELTFDEKRLLAEILLPLRYLIKHMAFKEEQECRMIYVTQIDNPLIKYDEKINRIYIDYEPSVMEHLEKIYLAPKAKDEKMVFEYLCSRGQEIRKGKDPVKVKISQNPFR
ncbi:tetratricopeptide repeat protein [Acinetobacter sp. NS-4]|uniref:tetratricopeptide repeat protein n=1 Tax=Acinetobacter sp. NS-4 TaxID=3127956 RepID=UPI00307E7409